MSFFAVMVMLLGGMWVIGYLKDMLYSRNNIEFHTLPIVSHVLAAPPRRVTIEDKSSYAGIETLDFYQYTRYFYDESILMAKADYDENGSLFQRNTWEYDAAGNIRMEQTENEIDGIQSYSYFYEYDSLGRVVHEEIYRDEDLMENNYFRHTDIGRAGVSYSYIDERMYGGISDFCSYHTEFLEDADGNPLYIFELNSLDLERPYEVWKMQWMQNGNRIVNRVQNYKDNEMRLWAHNNSAQSNFWYQWLEDADAEQVNLYEYNPETGKKNPILQLNYERQYELRDFCLMPSFYRAQYDGDNLLWQMRYSDSGLKYYSACQYDDAGRWEIAVEYEAEGNAPYALLYRYEYPEEDIVDEYIYLIQGQEFSHLFGDGENVLLTFSDTGILSGIEMTDVAGNILEKYEFREYGENSGKLEKMYTNTDVITGETAILEKLEEEAELCGFRVGENLANYEEEGTK